MKKLLSGVTLAAFLCVSGAAYAQEPAKTQDAKQDTTKKEEVKDAKQDTTKKEDKKDEKAKDKKKGKKEKPAFHKLG